MGYRCLLFSCVIWILTNLCLVCFIFNFICSNERLTFVKLFTVANLRYQLWYKTKLSDNLIKLVLAKLLNTEPLICLSPYDNYYSASGVISCPSKTSHNEEDNSVLVTSFSYFLGITVGDIGAKFSPLTNVTDNGFLMFDHVRIPLNQMLMGLAKVLSNFKLC